ncbi:MAG: PBP1A family penicillin-binding protein [Desulfobacterales bacterium]|nr:PBP1A family penicillin-binding protein [Desulfobacterales bacterium]MCF8078785.1 PBP1A family penicillin-binding protein [Desulfobacterales bacterium]
MSVAFGLLRKLRLLFYLAVLIAGIAAAAAIGLFFVVLEDLPKIPHPLSRIIETPPTEIFAADGQRVMVLGGREAVPLSRVSHHFINAVIATEDHRFWDHHGIDKLRTLKALYVTLFKPGKIQGASTITQQLAKNLFFSFERSWLRKFKEMLVAVQIESSYGKEEILEAYVNQIAFGVGAFGIEQAAHIFFGVPAADLTLSEAAMLAGLPKSPTRYNPYRHFERARQRQRIVLIRMADVGYISPEDARAAAQQELVLEPLRSSARSGSYFLDLVIDSLEAQYGAQVVYHGGLKVFTTLDPQLQAWAVASVQDGLATLDEELGVLKAEAERRPQGALTAVETRSGAVKAMVGGRDYAETEYNRAVYSQRLPGSGFKPFVYYAAFETENLHPATVAVDRPVRIPVVGARDWEPQNFSRRHRGPMILKRAFTQSVNTIAAQIVEQIGPDAVIQAAQKCGIQSPLDPVYSVALGTSGVSPLEMASAFATFATGGIRHDPFWIQRVEDAYGHVLEERIVSGRKSLNPEIAYQVVDMMQAVIENGTGEVIRRLGFRLPAAGKTGTTNDFRDAWFTGYTPTLSCSVWVGFDREAGLRDRNDRGVTGGRGAAPIWADFMKRAFEGEPAREFPVPDNIRFTPVDPSTGMPAGPSDPGAVQVALRPGQTPDGRILGSPALLPPGFDHRQEEQ